MDRNHPTPARWILSGAVILAIVAAGIFWFQSQSTSPSTPPVSAAATPAPLDPLSRYEPAPSVSVVAALQTPNPTIVRPVPAATPVRAMGFAPAGVMIPQEQMRVALMGVRTMLLDFRTLTGGNPIGTNAEIMQAIMGDNKKGAKLGPPEGQRLNAEGELLDPWGTPYFFHQISAQEMEIRSAGPDKKMWTDDDQVLK